MRELSDKSRRIREALFAQYLLRSHGVLHLGAHLGQEASLYANYNKPVIWIEARPDIHARLEKKLENFPHQRAICALLGDRDGGQFTLYISNNDEGVSSSIFQFGAYGQGEKSLWPELGLQMVDSITLPMIRLDTLLTSYQIDAKVHDFWVVDLQGAEICALNGAMETLNFCQSLFIEVSLKEVYKNGVLWNDLEIWLGNKGFEPLWQPELPHDDVLFIRPNLAEKDALAKFHSEHYKYHNKKSLEHLNSLNLLINNTKLLELGAKIGDHAEFYTDRECKVTVTDI